jgi:hypothetical protein
MDRNSSDSLRKHADQCREIADYATYIGAHIVADALRDCAEKALDRAVEIESGVLPPANVVTLGTFIAKREARKGPAPVNANWR